MADYEQVWCLYVHLISSMTKTSVSPSGEWTFTLVFLLSIIIAVMGFFDGSNTSSLWSIFSLYIELNASEKSTNRCVALRFVHKHQKNLADCQNSWCVLISTKAILVFPKDFCNFWFNVVEFQSIVDFHHYGSKGYTPVVLGNSKVNFLGEREDRALFPSALQYQRSIIKFPCFPYFWWYFIKTCSVPVFNFC